MRYEPYHKFGTISEFQNLFKIIVHGKTEMEYLTIIGVGLEMLPTPVVNVQLMEPV